jgi:hypothetical protein
MKKYRLLNWGMVVFMATMFSYGYFGLPENNDQNVIFYMNFQVDKPFLYRVLVPLIVHALMLFKIKIDIAAVIVVFASALASYWAIKELCAYYLFMIDEKARLLYSLIFFAFTFIILIEYRKTYDWMTVFLFCYLMYVMGNMIPVPKSGLQWGGFVGSVSVKYLIIYLLVFPIVVIHRETSILFVLLFAVYFWRRVQILAYIVTIIYQLTVWVTFRFVMDSIFSNANGGFHFLTHDVTGTYINDPRMIVILLVSLFTLWVVRRSWKSTPHLLQSAFLLVPVQIILHLLFGNPYEFRVFAETVPIILITVTHGFSTKPLFT